MTAWIFARAKELNFFEGQDSVSFDLLKLPLFRDSLSAAQLLKKERHCILRSYARRSKPALAISDPGTLLTLMTLMLLLN